MTEVPRLRPLDLMRLHVEALFAHDAHGRLLRVNEPGGAAAPRFFLGRTADGDLCRFRHDVDEEVRRALAAAVRDDPGRDPLDEGASHAARYATILARAAPVERTWVGPAFAFPQDLPAADQVVRVTAANASLLAPLLAAWTPDVATCQPMLALLVDGRAAALCCSVRRTAHAHEAGVETAPAHRGQAHAPHVVAAWARAVREAGREPLYSTSWENAPSRAVARRLGLVPFGSDLHLT
jgi:hypothetical protein